MTPSSRSRREAQAALTHLAGDGLPAYPPPRPWPAPPAWLLEGPLWVFGYGSLIWHPGFPFMESHVGRVHGHHRALCVWSWEYRGTVDAPGLVLGLDRGGSCTGVAFRVADEEREATVAYLLRRELPVAVYRPRRMSVHLDDGRTVHALAFVVARDQDRYARAMPEPRLFEVVASARGVRGSNAEYVCNTADHLAQLGIPCSRLQRLSRALRGG